MNGIIPNTNGGTVHVRMMECLHKRGYELFAEGIAALVEQHGKIRILFDMAGFHGWGKGAQWFDIDKVFPEVERVAFFGDPKWEQEIGALCKPFPGALLRYFESGSRTLAVEWVKANAV